MGQPEDLADLKQISNNSTNTARGGEKLSSFKVNFLQFYKYCQGVERNDQVLKHISYNSTHFAMTYDI